jgi:hypothetical protein
MFEPAKNSKAPDCSEALILLGRDGEITYGHLVVGWPQRKAISAARKTGFFVRAAFQPLVDFSSNKKSPRLRSCCIILYYKTAVIFLFCRNLETLFR